jgi:hypothetical protein
MALSAVSRRLTGFRQFARGNPLTQGNNLEKLASNDYQFTWVLPGHGRWKRYNSLQEKNQAIKECVVDYWSRAKFKDFMTHGYHPKGNTINMDLSGDR